MGILSVKKTGNTAQPPLKADLGGLLDDCSIEVMPRTAAKIPDFRSLLPQGTRIYIAHIDGTTIGDMVATARRLREEGFSPMPHIPARIIRDKAMLEDWIKRYSGEAGVDQALLLAGGIASPIGSLVSSLHLLETGLFDRYGFRRLHVAGHPEGNRNIDRDGTTRLVDEALKFKQSYAERSDAAMAIVTQFAFDAGPVVAWAERIAAAGIDLPIHIGIAGPTRLQALIKFAISCGVGPSLGVLQKRALDLSKLLSPYGPEEFLADLATYRASHPGSLIRRIHIFPLGGIEASAEWIGRSKAAEQRRSL